MRYRYLDDFQRSISVFAIFSYGIAVLGTPQCPPPVSTDFQTKIWVLFKFSASCLFLKRSVKTSEISAWIFL